MICEFRKNGASARRPLHSLNMKKLFHIYAVLSMTLLWLSSLFSMQAAEVSVTAKLDSATLLMGYTTKLRLSVDQPKNAQVSFPLLKNTSGRNYIGLLGDSVEISTNVVLDTASLGNNRIRVNYNLTVQSFDSGYYKLPPFEFLNGKDIVKSNQVSLKVIPVIVADDAEISGFTDIEEPLAVDKSLEDKGDKSLWDKLLDFWWLILLILVFAALLVWALRRYKKQGSLLPPKPVVPPYEEAVQSLHKLKSRKLWEKGKEKEYFTALTYILRRYLAKEYDIPAMEMTSRQIMVALKENEDLKGQRASMRSLLDMADFVKYAKVRPLPEDNEKAYEDTESFIAEAHNLYEKRKATEAAQASQSKSSGKVRKQGVRNKKIIKVGNRNSKKRK